MSEKVEVCFQTFVDDSPEEFGAVRDISPDGRAVTVYVENAGDFVVPAAAIVSVQSEKVTFACRKLDRKLRVAIGHAHDEETR
jgi:hypothetical protein